MRYIIILLIILAAFFLIRIGVKTAKKSKTFVNKLKKELNIKDVFGIEGEGEVIEKTFKFEPFEKIKLSRNVKVFLKQRNTCSVKVIADENLHDFIEINRQNNILHISLKENFSSAKKFEIYIDFVNLKYLKAYAGASVKNKEGGLKLSKLKLDVSSGANVRLYNCQADDLDFDVSTGANLYMSGKAKNLKVKSTTGSNVKLYDLTVENSKITASTAGNIKVNVTKSLDVVAKTGANISYKGSPKDVKKETKTGGNIRSISD